MSELAIRAIGISKQYRIGQQAKYKAFRDILANCFKSPIRRMKSVFKNPDYKNNEKKKINNYFWALRDVSFEIKHGEAVGIIGRNGAGKTTLLKVLARITSPTKGNVYIHGRVGSLLEVGTGFHPELTGRENIFLNGAIIGMRRKEILNKFDEIVEFAEVAKFIDTPVKHYSSGMHVRLAFAVAAHFEPEILLVDEVLAVGDVQFQKKCLGKMGEVAKEGRTVLFISHNMIAVKNLCSRAILLDHGQIICDDTVATVVEEYLATEKELNGEVAWNSPETAPGNHQVRLKAVRILSEGQVTGTPKVDKDIEIQIDYWNLEKDKLWWIGIHVLNAIGHILFTNSNVATASISSNPAINKKYPIGLLRTKFIIPKLLLNPGQHSINLYINNDYGSFNILKKSDIISFNVLESNEIRKNYLGEWIGAIRPILRWETIQID